MRDRTIASHEDAIRESADRLHRIAKRAEQTMSSWYRDDIREHADALAAERDALRDYALWLQDRRGSDIYGEACPSDTEISEAQAEHGVSDLLRDA